MLRSKPKVVGIGMLMQQLDENALNIYTDGSCRPSPRRGGVGFLFITVDEDGHEQVLEQCPPGWKSATNNQMELQAAIDALAFALDRHSPFDLSEFNKVVIHTDSMYVSDNYNKAKFEWPTRKWRTREGPPVANTQQWKRLVSLVKKSPLRVDIQWVKGHKDDRHNIRVDELGGGWAEPSADLLRQLDDDPLRAADVAEPITVFVALHLANDADVLHPLDSHVLDCSDTTVQLQRLSDADRLVGTRATPGGYPSPFDHRFAYWAKALDSRCILRQFGGPDDVLTGCHL